MGDVQFILGGALSGDASAGESQSGPFRRRVAAPVETAVPGKAPKKKALARELRGLLSGSAQNTEENNVPIVPTTVLIHRPAYKARRGAEKTVRW